jgi:hypothetical protein
MIKFLLSGIWICAITLISSYTAASWKADSGADTGALENLKGLNYEKTGPINVPMIQEGAVQGYVVAQFVFTADAKVLGKLSVPPHPFVLDEAFRAIYADERLDFRDLQKFDLAGLTKLVVERVNARFGTELLKDLLVEQFAYVTKDEVRAQSGQGGQGPVLYADGVTGAPPGEAAPAPEGGH